MFFAFSAAKILRITQLAQGISISRMAHIHHRFVRHFSARCALMPAGIAATFQLVVRINGVKRHLLVQN
jgi:hypothetical protein